MLEKIRAFFEYSIKISKIRMNFSNYEGNSVSLQASHAVRHTPHAATNDRKR